MNLKGNGLMATMLIDAHCHLDTFVERGTLTDVLAEAERNDVKGFVATGTCENDWEIYLDLARKHPSIACTLGLHPTEVNEGWPNVLEKLENLLKTQKPAAIGEVGMDFYWVKDADGRATQGKVFEKQLQLAKKYELPLVIHCREAFEAVKNVLDTVGFDWTKTIFHCFSGGPEEAKILKSKGAYASFSGNVTYKENVRQSLKFLSLENTLLETDCPYLAPVPHRGKENVPAFLKSTAQFVADFLNVPYEQVVEKTYLNTKKFFKYAF